MTKNKKTTYFKIENCGSLKLVKRPQTKKYAYQFYVSKSDKHKSGYILQSTRTHKKVDAIRIAKEEYFKFITSNQTRTDETLKIPNVNVLPEMTFDFYAQKYFAKLREQVNVNLATQKTYNDAVSRYDKEIKAYLGKSDIKKVSKNDIDAVKYHLLNPNRKPKQLQNKTINSYLLVISNILKYCLDENVIEKMPKVEVLEVYKKNNPNSYQPYTKKQINDITQKLRTIAKENVEYRHYDEVANIVNFLYFVPLRPGVEYLSLQHKHISWIDSIINGKKEQILIIDPPRRKVKQYNHPIPTHPIFKEIYFNRILRTTPRDTGEEYLFFNYDRNGMANYEQVRRKISKIFVKISKMLGYYYVKDSTRNRPLYSIRSTNFIETYARSGEKDLVAQVGNSSSRMLNSAYLNQFDNMKIVEVYRKLYAKK